MRPTDEFQFQKEDLPNSQDVRESAAHLAANPNLTAVAHNRKKSKSATAGDEAVDESATTSASANATNADATAPESDDVALLRANQEAQRAAALQYNLTATRA